MKTVDSLRFEYEVKMNYWNSVAEDEDALSDRGKTKMEALVLASYFEGKIDGLNDSLYVDRSSAKGG